MDKEIKENNKIISVYNFIVEFITTNGFSPSFREIADGVGIKSTSSVWDYLFMLEQYGKIRTQEFKPRTISLVGYAYVKKKTEE